MADEPENNEPEETEEPESQETDEAEENDNWGRLGKLIDERLDAWSAKQPKKTTSSPSRRRAEQPKRKQGFLTKGFFSNDRDK